MRTTLKFLIVICLLVFLVGCGKPESSGTATTSEPTKLKGKTGEWLPDRGIALMVKSFEKEPGFNRPSAVNSYAVKLQVKNTSSHPLTISRIQVEFNASDLREATEAVLGPANLKPGERFSPFRNNIAFKSEDGSSSDLSLGPGETKEFQIAGHFWFAMKDFALGITVFRQHQPIGGPFLVDVLP